MTTFPEPAGTAPRRRWFGNRSAAQPGPSTAAAVIIGFGGYGGSGKDAAAEFLVADGFRLLSFGTYVAAVLREVNPLVQVDETTERAADLLDRVGYEQAKKVPDFVRMLQDLGTAVNRRDPGLWARLVLADVEPGQRAVITGVRSRAQIEAVAAHGGLTVWVSRPGVQARNGHINETEVGPDDFHTTLDNTGTLDDLKREVDLLLATIDLAEAINTSQR